PPEQTLAAQRQETEYPEFLPFQAEHGKNEASRIRTQQKRRRPQVEQADAVLVAGRDLAQEEPLDIDEVKGHQAEENEDLRPLGGVAAKGAKILDDEQPGLRIEKLHQSAEG